ncbi:unnamed protein product [Rotaria socialis]|uniref:Uncharacterized protein n=1 Tax=Rotaria socialis TaxID=392032 RepID=A0A820S3A0_9BILA|nr:unnamed protein product [Rotaria socialis]CAF4444228.1 unnamed protein product [Rotaria socialis]CAF4887244.1 unnamed protein product [Rotaria socialis]
MEENLLNELENFTSIKYLDDVTNNNCCNDDDQDNSLAHQLAIKDRQLILAAKCGKALLEEKDELERQIELMNRDYQQRIDLLEQERHELRLLLEQVQSECDTKGCTNESRLQEQLRLLRQQADTASQTNTEQTQDLSKIKQQFDNLHCQYLQLELDHHLLLEEHDTLTHKLDECQRKCIIIEDECRSLQDIKFHNEKELNDAHELIHRLSQCNPENRVPTSFMQELQDDFGVCPNSNAPFNSTVIDDDHDDSTEEHEDCHMDEDDHDHVVEIAQTQTNASINEKCLLDEFLQTEEFKREIVLVYKQLRSLCLELIYIHTHTYSSNLSTSSSISDTVDKVYDRLKNGCLISILFELKNLIRDMIEHEDMIVCKNENNTLPNTNTIIPSPSMATINSYASAFDDVNLFILSSSPKFRGEQGIEFIIASPKQRSVNTDIERDERLPTICFLSQSSSNVRRINNGNFNNPKFSLDEQDAIYTKASHDKEQWFTRWAAQNN